MSFRRSDSDTPARSRWRRNHRSILLQWFPPRIVDSDRLLNYVFLHGADGIHGGWCPSSLASDEAARLLAFLKQEFPDPCGYCLIADLERQLRND